MLSDFFLYSSIMSSRRPRAFSAKARSNPVIKATPPTRAGIPVPPAKTVAAPAALAAAPISGSPPSALQRAINAVGRDCKTCPKRSVGAANVPSGKTVIQPTPATANISAGRLGAMAVQSAQARAQSARAVITARGLPRSSKGPIIPAVPISVPTTADTKYGADESEKPASAAMTEVVESTESKETKEAKEAKEAKELPTVATTALLASSPLSTAAAQGRDEVGLIRKDKDFQNAVVQQCVKYLKQFAEECPESTIQKMVESIVLEVDQVSIYMYTPLIWAASRQVDSVGGNWALKLRHLVASQLIKGVVYEAYNHNVPTRMKDWCFWHLINQLELNIFPTRIANKKKWLYNIKEQKERAKTAAAVATKTRERRQGGRPASATSSTQPVVSTTIVPPTPTVAATISTPSSAAAAAPTAASA